MSLLEALYRLAGANLKMSSAYSTVFYDFDVILEFTSIRRHKELQKTLNSNLCLRQAGYRPWIFTLTLQRLNRPSCSLTQISKILPNFYLLLSGYGGNCLMKLVDEIEVLRRKIEPKSEDIIGSVSLIRAVDFIETAF